MTEALPPPSRRAVARQLAIGLAAAGITFGMARFVGMTLWSRRDRQWTAEP
jgi:hypothetical protein